MEIDLDTAQLAILNDNNTYESKLLKDKFNFTEISTIISFSLSLILQLQSHLSPSTHGMVTESFDTDLIPQ